MFLGEQSHPYLLKGDKISRESCPCTGGVSVCARGSLIPVSALGASAVFAEFLALSEVLFSSSSVQTLNRDIVWGLSQNTPPPSAQLPSLLC